MRHVSLRCCHIICLRIVKRIATVGTRREFRRDIALRLPKPTGEVARSVEDRGLSTYGQQVGADSVVCYQGGLAR
jgi:hypothetical protein